MAGGSILIVDDDRSFVDAVAIYLEDHGFRVSTACTGMSGIAACRRHRVDLAIVDVHLPDMAGTLVAQALLERQRASRVLFISSDDSPETVGRCLTENGHVFMAKPLIPAELLLAVSRLCTQAIGAGGEIVSGRRLRSGAA